MGLRKGLGALVALLVIGALAAGASAATATATATSKPKHKPAPARKKLHVCSIGQRSGPGRCLANPLYAKTACDAWTPKVEALVGGPAQVSPAGNPSSFATGIVCQWRAGDELALIQGGTALGEVPLTISFSVGSLGTTTATAAEFRTNLKHIQDAVAMPLSELQKDFETNATLWETPCYVQDPPGAVDHVIPFDPPHMLSGLGDLAYSWDVCTTAMAGIPPCTSVPKDKTGGGIVRCSVGWWWDSEVAVLKGKVSYYISIKRPEMTITDDQLVTFLKTVMAKYH